MARQIHLAARSGTTAGTGESWAQARAVTDLSQALATIEPDDEILVGFSRDHEHPWFWSKTAADLSRSGLPGRPIRLSFGFIGGDGTLVPATPGSGWPLLRRSATGWPLRTDPELSGEPFLSISGSSVLVLSGPVAEGAPGAGLMSFSGRIDTLTLRDLHLRNVGRGIETTDDSEINGLCLESCSARGLGRGFARFHKLSNAVLRDLRLDADFTDGGATRVLQLIAVSAGENLRFENITLRNAVSAIDATARGSSFVQGDGIVLEADTRAAQFLNCHAANLGDAGFDLKCDGFQMSDCSARGCKYGVRIWRANPTNKLSRTVISATRPRAENAAACIWLGGQADLEDCHLSAGAESAAIRFGEGPDAGPRRAILRGGSIETAGGGSFLAGDPGEVVMHDVLLDGRLVNGSAFWDGQALRLP